MANEIDKKDKNTDPNSDLKKSTDKFILEQIANFVRSAFEKNDAGALRRIAGLIAKKNISNPDELVTFIQHSNDPYIVSVCALAYEFASEKYTRIQISESLPQIKSSNELLKLIEVHTKEILDNDTEIRNKIRGSYFKDPENRKSILDQIQTSYEKKDGEHLRRLTKFIAGNYEDHPFKLKKYFDSENNDLFAGILTSAYYLLEDDLSPALEREFGGLGIIVRDTKTDIVLVRNQFHFAQIFGNALQRARCFESSLQNAQIFENALQYAQFHDEALFYSMCTEPALTNAVMSRKIMESIQFSSPLEEYIQRLNIKTNCNDLTQSSD